MTEQIQQANVSSDELMTKALRACGFHVRTLNLAPGQRPQVVGNIDHAAALFKLTVASTDAAIAQHAASVPAVDEHDVIVDRRDLFDFLRSAWRDGQNHGGEMDEVDRWSRGSDYANKAIKGWATLRAAPVPAASVQPDAEAELLDMLGRIHPMAMRREDDIGGGKERLTRAFTRQQPWPVPDQACIVWRADLMRMSYDLTRKQAFFDHALEKQASEQPDKGHAA